MLEPLARFTEDQLESALDEALTSDQWKGIWDIIAEMDRRGHVLEV